MSHLVRSTPPDELDGLLRGYFQAEMPDPWPSLEAPAPRHALPAMPPSGRKAFWGSRLALAASLALLLGGSVFLSGSLPAGKQPEGVPTKDPTATRPTTPGAIKELIQDPDGTLKKMIVPLDDDLPIK